MMIATINQDEIYADAIALALRNQNVTIIPAHEITIEQVKDSLPKPLPIPRISRRQLRKLRK